LIAKICEFEKKLVDLGLAPDQLAQAIQMHPMMLKRKLIEPDNDFSLAEAEYIASITDMSEAEFLWIFFGEKLSLNESLSNK
jgi:hypothetical protein